MKILYFDLGMGAAGDMLTASLLELLPDPEAFVRKLNQTDIPGVTFELEKSTKCGITGTHLSVKVNGIEETSEDYDMNGQAHTDLHSHEQGSEEEHAQEHDHADEHMHDHNHADAQEHVHDHTGHTHSHNDMQGIKHIVCDHMNVTPEVQEDVLKVYSLIADAESRVHNVPVSGIHFHEVGNMDAVADVTAFCMLLREINPDRIVASPVHVGSGHVKCAHGILPVPAPATALILQGIPIYGGSIQGELCTPTGAALIRFAVQSFGNMPVMSVERIGYGCGKKDFEIANCVRAMLGEGNGTEDTITELSCNMDDCTGEMLGFAMEKLFEAGARDVYTVPITMKKNRPGILLRVMCTEEKKDDIVKAIFRYTTTIGIREQQMKRFVLDRSIDTVDTSLGPIRKKTVSGYGITRSKWEYDDMASAASAKGISLAEAEKAIASEVR